MLEKPPIGAACNACGLCCRATVCSAGSMALGLVDRLGERAPGPCPALHLHADGRETCGVVERPKDWMPGNPKSVTALREAFALLIGSNAGCDEIGDEPGWSADPKLQELAEGYVRRVTPAALVRARKVLFG